MIIATKVEIKLIGFGYRNTTRNHQNKKSELVA